MNILKMTFYNRLDSFIEFNLKTFKILIEKLNSFKGLTLLLQKNIQENLKCLYK